LDYAELGHFEHQARGDIAPMLQSRSIRRRREAVSATVCAEMLTATTGAKPAPGARAGTIEFGSLSKDEAST
jgi:hypothetical protein